MHAQRTRFLATRRTQLRSPRSCLQQVRGVRLLLGVCRIKPSCKLSCVAGAGKVRFVWLRSAQVAEKVRTKAIAVVGAQWGDEGKGQGRRLPGLSFDYTARYAGGHNAGHTVIFNGHRYVLQLVPSGILRPEKKAVIGPGAVVDPAALVAELENLRKSGIEVRGRLFLSNRAHLIFPYHREMDKAAESARGEAKIGTTSRGIGPAYEDKMARRGIRVCDLLEPECFRVKLERVIAEKNAISQAAYGHALETAGLLEQYLEIAAHIRGLGGRHGRAAERRARSRRIGALRGRAGHDAGHRPWHVSLRYVVECDFGRRLRTGLGVAPTRITGVVGVTKAYTTRVGSGPFPTEMPDLDAAGSARARKRIRRGDRAPAPLRLARSGGPALRENAQRHRFAGGDQARRVRRAAGN